jgi:hypothetical protein
MPNHVHAIIIITTDNVGAGPCACPITTQPQNFGQSQDTGQPQGVAPTENAQSSDTNKKTKNGVSPIPDIGFRILKLDDTNMNDVYYAATETT